MQRNFFSKSQLNSQKAFQLPIYKKNNRKLCIFKQGGNFQKSAEKKYMAKQAEKTSTHKTILGNLKVKNRYLGKNEQMQSVVERSENRRKQSSLENKQLQRHSTISPSSLHDDGKNKQLSSLIPDPFSTIPQQEHFFPVLEQRKVNPLRIKQLHQIREKQKRQGLNLYKLKRYKQLLENEILLRKSKARYQQNRHMRSSRLHNISFLNLRERFIEENQHSSSVDFEGKDLTSMGFRTNSLYFKTQDKLQGTIRQVGCYEEPLELKMREFQRNRRYLKEKSAAIQKLNNGSRTGRGSGFEDIQESSDVPRYLLSSIDAEEESSLNPEDQILREKKRINYMIRQYREYEEQEAKNKHKSQTQHANQVSKVLNQSIQE